MILFLCIQALLLFISWLPLISGHTSIWHPSMYGFNVTFSTFPYDNRPVAPLYNYTFEQWWFHGHLGYPPNPGDIFELPAGQTVTAEVACTKAATSFYNTSDGGDVRSGDDPCPNSPTSAYHTTGIDDVKGCAMAIAYKSNVSDIQPEDFAVFSVNHTCVWHRFTDFQVPVRMPPCPEGGCICAWFWIHSPDSGSEQNYMNGFKCNITDSVSASPVAPAQLARRCGADPDNGVPEATPGNCTYGSKMPFYWLQQERNNMFEGYYSPPFYTNLYNFVDGAQEDIFVDSYPEIPPPRPDSSVIPTPIPYSYSTAGSAADSAATATSSSASAASAASVQPTSSVNRTSPTASTGRGKAKICKLSANTPQLQSNVELHRRSFFHSFLARSRARRTTSKRYSLWHPF